MCDIFKGLNGQITRSGGMIKWNKELYMHMEISQIEEWKADPKNGINWNNYNENSLFWDLQGMIGYRVHINHVKKTVILVHSMKTI